MDPLKAKLYTACLEAALTLGSDIKKFSWLGRNAKRSPSALAADEKAKAA